MHASSRRLTKRQEAEGPLAEAQHLAFWREELAPQDRILLGTGAA